MQPIQKTTDSAPNWGDNDPLQKIDGDVNISGIINKGTGNADKYLKVNAAGNAMEWATITIPTNEGKWNDATGGIHYSSGDVGIGTSSPSDRLHLYKEDSDTYLTIQNKRTTTNTTQYLSGIKFETSSGNLTDEWVASRIVSGWLPSENAWNQSWIKFQTHGTNGGNFTDDLVIKGGNVGIGTTSPDNTLQVVSTMGEMVEFKNTSTYSRFVLNGATSTGGDLIFKQNGTAKWGIANIGNDLFFMGDDNTGQKYMTLKDNGNVGIGTTSPNYKIDFGDDGGWISIRSDNINHSGKYGYGMGYWTDGANNHGVAFSAGGNFIMSDQNNTPNLFIKQGGNVGIGTKSWSKITSE